MEFIRESSEGDISRDQDTDLIGNSEYQKLVWLLIEHNAFDEGTAMLLLYGSPEWRSMFHNNFAKHLRTAIFNAKIFVFQDKEEQRLQWCKDLQIQSDPDANEAATIRKGVQNLENLLNINNINPYEFGEQTYDHFFKKTNENNLFFCGPPDTGKTMIMESLVAMHLNFTRLTGLPMSKYHFANLLHRNACFMDEFKLTPKNVEELKLLSARQPTPTYVKYRNKQYIEDCVIYTASCYPLLSYVVKEEDKDAIARRTIQFYFHHHTEYFKLNAFIWEKFWEKYACGKCFETANKYLVRWTKPIYN